MPLSLLSIFNMSQDNNRIAKNTLLLYFRMLLMMVLSLFTSRITLDALGIVDYGIYNVVGGVVSMFTIVTGAITVSISRYITMEIGLNNKEQQVKVFSTSVIILLVLSGILVFIAETAGIWFLNHKLVIPDERLYAAHWVLQCSIVTFVLGLLSVPYNAVIVAHERMSAFAYISILDVVFKLLLVYLLYIAEVDKLILFAVFLALWSVVMRIIYGVYCNRNFEETHFKMVYDRKLLKSMSGFIGWAFWGNGVVVLKDQGTNILLNMFCGPVVNAARGIAMQVNSAVYGFVSNFLMAVNPQITKCYAQRDYSRMHLLIIKSTKLSFFIMMLLLLPICVNIDYILKLWLVEVPAHAANFIVLILLYSMIDCYTQPMITGVLAEGNIKRYEIILTVLYSLNFMVAYILLKIGLSPEYVFGLNILFKSFVAIALTWQASWTFGFPLKEFLRQCIVPTLFCFTGTAVILMFLPVHEADNIVSFIIKSLAVFLVSILIVYVFGITKSESKYVLDKIKTKLHL